MQMLSSATTMQIVASICAVLLIALSVWLAVTAVHLSKRRKVVQSAAQTSLTPAIVALSVAAAVSLVHAVLAALLAARFGARSRLQESARKPADQLSFSADIKPLFRLKDVLAMRQAGSFDLHNYDDVSEYAQAIYDRVSEGTMPCDGAWSVDKVNLFRRWLDAGKKA